MRLYGWQGNVLSIDLSKEKINYSNIDDKLLNNYLGGRGLGAILFCKYNEKNIISNPLDDNNVLIFSTGPLTGTLVPTSGRCSVTTLSPLTNTIFDSNIGGYFGVYFKKCSIDALMITGKAKNFVYLYIDEKDDKILDAEKYCGMPISETTYQLQKIHNGKILTIGIAGEKLVSYACASCEKRFFGRGGVGAVMSSKKLKAIVVNGNMQIKVKDKDRLRDYVNASIKRLESNPITSKGLHKYGTNVLMNVINTCKILPIANFKKTYSRLAEKISAETFIEKYTPQRKGCYNCNIRCEGRVGETKIPEYETTWALGANLKIFDCEKILKLAEKCDEYGLDSISTGGSIACYMEKYKKFGDFKLCSQLIDKIAHNKTQLSQGSKKFDQRYAMQVKSLELPGYHPKGAYGMALAYATSNRGGCHLRAYMVGQEILSSPKYFDRFAKDKANVVIRTQNIFAVYDSLIVCKFTSFALTEHYFARMLSAVTGRTFTSEHLHNIGNTIWNLEREYNRSRGFTSKDDTLPKRFKNIPLKDMLKVYYEIRGWKE